MPRKSPSRHGAAGSVCVFSFAPAHVVVDVTGFFTDDPSFPGHRLQPMAPLRVMDTRAGTNGTRLPGG